MYVHGCKLMHITAPSVCTFISFSIHVLRNQLNVQCFCNFMSRYKVIIPSLHNMYISHKLKMYTIYTWLYISGFLGGWGPDHKK